MQPRIMYIESKASDKAYIGRVTFSRSGQTIYYRNWTFYRITRGGVDANYREKTTGIEFWISGPKKDGKDRLFRQRVPVAIDEDVRDEYWTRIRRCPEKKDRRAA